jgi:hypothetical protein
MRRWCPAGAITRAVRLESGVFGGVRPGRRAVVRAGGRGKGHRPVRKNGTRVTPGRVASRIEFTHGQLLRTARPGSAAEQRDLAKALADLYAAWQVDQPDQGHDEKAAEWRARLAANEAPTQAKSP